jgi:hypothetical protein
MHTHCATVPAIVRRLLRLSLVRDSHSRLWVGPAVLFSPSLSHVPVPFLIRCCERWGYLRIPTCYYVVHRMLPGAC